jgi:hypothetical protein
MFGRVRQSRPHRLYPIVVVLTVTTLATEHYCGVTRVSVKRVEKAVVVSLKTPQCLRSNLPLLEFYQERLRGCFEGIAGMVRAVVIEEMLHDSVAIALRDRFS